MNEEFKCSQIRGGLLTNSNLSVSFFKVITIIYENIYDGVCRPTSVHVFLTQNKETIPVKWTKTRLLLVNVRMRMNWERRLERDLNIRRSYKVETFGGVFLFGWLHINRSNPYYHVPDWEFVYSLQLTEWLSVHQRGKDELFELWFKLICVNCVTFHKLQLHTVCTLAGRCSWTRSLIMAKVQHILPAYAAAGVPNIHLVINLVKQIN